MSKPLAPNLLKTAASSILEQAIIATKQTTRTEATELLRELTNRALDGTIQWHKSVVASISTAIKDIDASISKQLALIMHQPTFTQLEGSWRGLEYFVKNTETSQQLKIRLLNISKHALFKDLDKAIEFDQSQLFKKIYEAEFGMPGGQPYGVLIGDYEFGKHPEDIAMLSKLSGIAAAAFCPFIAATHASMFGFDDWTELAHPRDLEKIFDSLEYTQWNSFRHSEDARFITLTMPRVLARLPYGAATQPIDAFNYEEIPHRPDGSLRNAAHPDYCWMNASYVLGSRLTHAFAKYGFCTAIRGMENGGKVDNLPLHVFTTDAGDIDCKCPTEVGITDRREAELSKLGFLPLSHYRNTDYAVFFGADTTQKPKKYDRAAATANAKISTRLPYIMATSRFAHYLKVMARDKIGSFMEAEDLEIWLNRWIMTYVNGNAKAKGDLKAKYPLADAKIQVREIPGDPGSYQAIAWLRPWLQLEELTTSLRMVARIPKLNKE